MTRALPNIALTLAALVVLTVLVADYGKAAAEFYQPHRIVECRR